MVDKRNIKALKHRTSRAFTLVEVMLAAVIAALILGSLAVTMGQLGQLKETTKLRLDAHLRAESALNAMRRDIASVIRHDDLFWTRLLIRQGTARSPIGDLMRDEILVFNTRLEAMQDLDFHGEGMQYETQYRIEESPHGAMLWQRRDPVPDEFPLAGGVATPMVDGVIGLLIEAYDGWEWTSHWDSDERGLPLAVRITVAASGARNSHDLYDAPIVQLRAVVPIDRVLPPNDLRPTDEELEELLAQVDDVSDEPSRSEARGARGGRGSSPGGGRPGAGAPGRGPPGGARPGGGGRGGTVQPGHVPSPRGG